MQLDGPVVIVATKNKGKVREFAHAFAPFGKEVRSMYDYPDIPDVVEDGKTFAENALKKAKAVGDVLGLPVLADDSGLCVDLLDGAPGYTLPVMLEKVPAITKTILSCSTFWNRSSWVMIRDSLC